MRRSSLLSLTLVTAAALEACSGTSPSLQPIRPAATPTPAATPSPVRTATPAPTATPVPTPTAVPTATPKATPTPVPTATPSPTATPTAVPQVISIGFQHGESTDPTFGPIYFYALTPNAPNAHIITVPHGSKIVFLQDDSTTPGIEHTAGGFGSSGFPASFAASGNGDQFTQAGTTIQGNQWSTGILDSGQMSQVFTVGPPGNYFFGCGFHYTTVPTAINGSMGDVLVST